MKLRQAFVSNSSSSSFVLATKGKMPEKRMYTLIRDALKVPADSPLAWVADSIADEFSHLEPLTIASLADKMGYDGYLGCLAKNAFVSSALNKGLTTFYYGSASNQDDLANWILCDTALSVYTDELMLEKEAGF